MPVTRLTVITQSKSMIYYPICKQFSLALQRVQKVNTMYTVKFQFFYHQKCSFY